MKTKTTKIYRAMVDIPKAAEGLCVDPVIFEASLRDGRTISRWAEIWVSVIYDLKLLKTNTPGADSVGSLDSNYSTKALTKHGTAVRLSSNTGKGRTCTPEDVSKAIEDVVAYNFVDNTKLPELSFIQIPSSVIMKWFRDGNIGKTGQIGYERFYEVLGPIEIVKVALLTGEIL